MKIPFPICLHRTTAVLGLRKARMAVRIRLEAPYARLLELVDRHD